MKVTLQIPTLNEAGSLAKTLKQVPREAINEILVIDGHSIDDTIKIAESLGCRAILQPKKGYGNAMKYGFTQAKGDIIIIMDADGSPQPKDIPRLIKKMGEGNYDMVLGSRYLPGGGSQDDTLIRYIGNKLFTRITNLRHGSKFSDSLYMFAAMKKDMLLNLGLKSEDFALCIEILVKAHKKGYKIGEVPCFERVRFASESRVNALTDGIKILWQLLWW